MECAWKLFLNAAPFRLKSVARMCAQVEPPDQPLSREHLSAPELEVFAHLSSQPGEGQEPFSGQNVARDHVEKRSGCGGRHSARWAR